jgi:hypothetical protein
MWLWLARRPGGQRHRRDKSHCADGNRGRSGAGKRASVLRTASGCCIWLYLAMCAAYCVVMLRTCANRRSATKSKCSRCCSVRLSATASSLAATSVVANCAASLAVSPARRMRWTGRRSRSASTTAQRSPTKSNEVQRSPTKSNEVQRSPTSAISSRARRVPGPKGIET